MNKREEIYLDKIAQSEKRIVGLKKRLVLVSLVRFLFFLMALGAPFYFYTLNIGWAVVSFVLPFSFFLVLVKFYFRLTDEKQFELHKVKINQDELEAIQHRFLMFDDGAEFIDPNHINSYDLDLFGKGSLYQYINRTISIAGRNRLAKMIQVPMLNPKAIVLRQQLISELAEMIDWRQNFSAQGKMYDEVKAESEVFNLWENDEYNLKTFAAAKIYLLLLPLFALVSIVFWIVSGNSGLFTLSALIQFGMWAIEHKNIKIIYSQFGKRVKVLQKFGLLLKYIEEMKWTSDEGKSVVADLHKAGMPSDEITKLKRIISAFDNRNNIIFGIVLNIIFLWDIWSCFRLINWHRKNKNNYHRWMETIAFVDGCNSLANYAFNHPDFSYPEFCSGAFQLSGNQLGHPLIQASKRIDNDIELGNQAVIVTGANMSGKSTFLRTVGVNMVLGMSGAPVCAASLKFKPVEVFSNMRTTDSLFDDESYFFAELKRLKAILDEVDQGKELLIILDEILKGTNSVDKLYGSQKLVHRLLEQKTTAIIATHDLKLTEIEHEFPEQVKNKCFEIEIKNDEMHFDYQLRDGVTTIMNATFLMKKMGIIQ